MIKQILWNIIGSSHMFTSSTIEDVAGKFTLSIEGMTMTVIDEVDEVSFKQLALLKALMTEDVTRVEMSGGKFEGDEWRKHLLSLF